LDDLPPGRSESTEDLAFEEIGVAERGREGADEEIAEVVKVIRQLEEFRQELKRLRRVLREVEKPQTRQFTQSLNSAMGYGVSYIT